VAWLAYSHLGVAKAVELTTQPDGAQNGIPLLTQPAGKLVDGSGVLSRTSGVVITPSITGGSGTIVGQTSAQTVEGVFTFTGLEVDSASGPLTLTFASTGLTSAVSDSFGVAAAYTLVIGSGAYTWTGSDVGIGGLYPNEPSGFTPYVEHSMDVVPGGSGSTNTNGTLGLWWHRASDESNMAIQSNGSGEQSNPYYLSCKFPSGLQDGASPLFYLGTRNPNTGDADMGLDEMYVSVWLRVRGNASSASANDGTTYENQSSYTKLWYHAHKYPPSQQNNSILVTLNNGSGQGAGTMAYETEWNLTMGVEVVSADGTSPYGGPPSPPSGPNIDNTKYIKLGQWHHVEYWAKLNTLTANPPPSDGQMKMWIDGVLVSHRTDLRFRSETYPYGFRQFHADMIFGGDAGEVKTRDDYIDIGHVYMSGVDQ